VRHVFGALSFGQRLPGEINALFPVWRELDGATRRVGRKKAHKNNLD
jgi:hypothetical protein